MSCSVYKYFNVRLYSGITDSKLNEHETSVNPDMQTELSDTQTNNPRHKPENNASTDAPQGIINKKSLAENQRCRL